jgi:cytochrome d ubiquinol oxidase subunit I
MDPVLLARIQFALTAGFHFIFPPLSIGMAWLLVGLMSRYVKTGSELDERIARFWVRLFGLTFAVGVATGITMEFQFGTNWANYSRFVGDIFGAPLAAEAIFSFFLESSFLAVLLLGWNRVSKKVHLTSTYLVAIGATLSALWIIIANSWMQTPAGYAMVPKGTMLMPQLNDFFAAAFNPSTLPRVTHTLIAALITGAYFMTGISAWFLLKGQNVEYARPTLHRGVITAAVASILLLVVGHWHAVQVAMTQPTKLAAFEGLFTTQDHAPLTLIGLPNAEKGTLDYALQVPAGLSMLVGNNPNTVVQGLDKTPKADWPPLIMSFVPFHLMFLLGFYFIGFGLLGLWLRFRGTLETNRFYLTLALFSMPLPFLANELGWTAAEVGRQPWIVYNLMRTAQASSPNVSAWQIIFSIALLLAIYTVLFIVWIGAIRREMRRGFAAETTTTTVKEVTA